MLNFIEKTSVVLVAIKVCHSHNGICQFHVVNTRNSDTSRPTWLSFRGAYILVFLSRILSVFVCFGATDLHISSPHPHYVIHLFCLALLSQPLFFLLFDFATYIRLLICRTLGVLFITRPNRPCYVLFFVYILCLICSFLTLFPFYPRFF